MHEACHEEPIFVVHARSKDSNICLQQSAAPIIGYNPDINIIYVDYLLRTGG